MWNYTEVFAPIPLSDDSSVEDTEETVIGEKNDEYFMAGRIIAVSLVHGGPSPSFLSAYLMRHILGIDDIHATLEDIDDHEIKGILFNGHPC
ncbi:UNVERIFIED_CONTAM: hypothetical protein FKN15_047735 [Acipenser sinensis]